MKKIICTITLALTLTSCADFLNESPRHKWDVDKAMTTYNNAVQSITGIYSQFMPKDNLNMKLSASYTTRSGMINTADSKDDKDKYFLYKQINVPTEFWNTAYKVINAANLSINSIPGIPDSAFPNDKAKNELIGEARLLRAYANSILLLNYSLWWDTDDSKYGIVYRDKVADVSNVLVPRITVGESWNKIFEDLDFAIANMSDNFVTARTASKLFAKAYKAKLLLIRGAERNSDADIKASKTLIDECIASLPSSVKVLPSMKEHFEQSWDSKENIFVRYLEDNASRTDNAGYFCDYAFGYNAATKCIVNDIDIPQNEAECGLEYGIEWMRNDPRWYVATGKARNPETWDDKYSWTWTKIYRKGRVGGKLAPIDEKYAVYLMRVPELYIMQAELCARTGASLADAIAPINTFRAMRTTPKLDPIATPADQQALWDAIFQEYCKELILENGSEYFASLRIKKGSKTYMEEIKGAEFNYNPKIRQYPIPNGEMVSNTMLEGMQNPGQE